jgi:cobalt-zinc-cadmium efflux system membrane fusion protein
MNALYKLSARLSINISLLLLLGTLAGCSGKSSAPVADELMCAEHGVPERFCTLCHPELKSELLMCQEHGVPEEICTVCHPEAIQKYGLKKICKEHGLPESLCPKCNPGLGNAEAKSDWCPRHGVPKSLCTICDPELAKKLPMCAEHGMPQAICTVCRPELARNFTTCALHNRPAAFCSHPQCKANAENHAAARELPLVRLAGADVAQKAGIATVVAESSFMSLTIAANGEVDYDRTRLAHVRPRITGVVSEVLVKPGDTIRAGQALAVVDSAELGQAKADYLAAEPLVNLWKKTFSRHQGLDQQGVIAGKQVFEAQAELQRAEAELLKSAQRLRNFGLDKEQIALLAQEDEQRRNKLTIIAPLSGTVIRVSTVLGEAVEPASEMFSLADVSRVWINLHIYEKDLRRIEIGQPVVFRVPGLEPAEFHGKVSWIDSEMDAQTRTVRVRVEASNAQQLLRINMFGRGEIEVGKRQSALLVPREAVQWEGASYVVFAQTRVDQFEPRRVLIGQNMGKEIELAWADLKPGESVVTAGSFLLKTEIQKGSIGAGCCGD